MTAPLLLSPSQVGRTATPKLVKIGAIARVLGVSDETIRGMCERGKVRACKVTAGRNSSRAGGHWVVSLSTALAIMRAYLEPGRARNAAIRACYRAADRLQDSVHAVGLRPATPPEAGKPVSDALLDP